MKEIVLKPKKRKKKMATELALVPIEEKTLTLCQKAQALKVIDQISHDAAAELYLGLSALEKEISALHDPSIAACFAAHKAAIAAKQKLVGPVEQAKRIIKPKITSWEDEQRRIQAELQRQAEKQARKIEEEARLALAVQAEQQGATEETVAEIIETPVQIVVPVVAPTFQKVKGFTSRAYYSCEVVNFAALVQAAALNPNMMCYLLPNDSALNKLADSMKETFKLPGCKLNKSMV
jgi:vacuolar-type H+-ATPase subunit E/Vma4